MTYPETRVGGFSRIDGTVAFYQRVQAVLPERGTVVDFGAGRGRNVEDPSPYRRQLRDLRGDNRHVIGLDVDCAVLSNPMVDDAYVIDPDGSWPFPDRSVDLILSDFVFEHIRDPERVADEMARVVRPGGWVCARTPNRWGYIGIGARAVPNRIHVDVLRILQPTKPPEDTFPTVYRLNSRSAIDRVFGELFDVVMYAADGDPTYAGPSAAAATIMTTLRLLPPPVRSMWMIFMQRRGD